MFGGNLLLNFSDFHRNGIRNLIFREGFLRKFGGGLCIILLYNELGFPFCFQTTKPYSGDCQKRMMTKYNRLSKNQHFSKRKVNR